MPADFNVSEYARGAFGIAGGKPETVELVFDAEMAGYIRERVWHESQALEDEPGRLACVLTMRWRPSFELQGLDQGLPAARARSCKPASLRDEIARDLQAARKAFPAPSG